MNPLLRMQGPAFETNTVPAIDCIITLAFFGPPPPLRRILRPRAFPAEDRRDFLVDNSDRRSYAYLKHKKAIYLLALSFSLPWGGKPKRGTPSCRKVGSTGARKTCSCSRGGQRRGRPLVFRALGNSFVETIQPDGFASKKARKGVDIMKITEVRVFPVTEERLKGYATIIFDDCFIVRDLKIIHGNTGLFVAMPSKKRKDGTFKDTAHPLNNSTRRMIEERVLDEYRKELDRLRDSPTGTET